LRPSVSDLVLNSLFTVEMIIRIIALGGITEYLASTWNLFDALMVFAGYTVFIPMGDANQGMEGLRALRALRALRPLRTIARYVRRGAQLAYCFDNLLLGCWPLMVVPLCS
jgi:hypothetical protein